MEENNNAIWNSILELAIALQKNYSVVDKKAIKEKYLFQIKQYPLYLNWFEKIAKLVLSTDKKLDILEYGPGPGILAGKLVNLKNVKSYKCIEPEEVFRAMTIDETNNRAIIINNVAEKYTSPNSFDLVIATATYHHFDDKVRSLVNIYNNLRKDGTLIIADGFIPHYSFNSEYKPLDNSEFIEKVLQYASSQVLSMPEPSEEEIIDQMRTAFLDIIRFEELKVCFPILKKQLEEIGFTNIRYELMKGENSKVNYEHLGYYFIIATK